MLAPVSDLCFDGNDTERTDNNLFCRRHNRLHRGGNMRYALVIWETEESRQLIQRDRAAHRAAYEEWIATVAATGQLRGGEALETDGSDPVTVRNAVGGGLIVSDGPAVPGAETIGGWFIVDVADQDEAIQLASSITTPEVIEIRPILESA
jgi:hypothetical protein